MPIAWISLALYVAAVVALCVFWRYAWAGIGRWLLEECPVGLHKLFATDAHIPCDMIGLCATRGVS